MAARARRVAKGIIFESGAVVMAFWQLLKRDLRLLVPVSVVFFALALTFYVFVIWFRLGVRPFSEEEHVVVVIGLYWWLMFIYMIAVCVEVVWREWRQRTHAYWYAFSQALHAKIISKVLAVGIVSSIVWSVLDTVFRVLLKYVTVPEVYAEVFPMWFYADIWSMLWTATIVCAHFILVTMLIVFVFLGIKGWLRFIFAPVTFIIGSIGYLMMFSYVSPKNEQEFPAEIAVNGSLMVLDIIYLIFSYIALYYFLSRKISL
ncbi:hypothetical protein NSQ26_08900 [Bacillus sp. FSL W7-1360]